MTKLRTWIDNERVAGWLMAGPALLGLTAFIAVPFLLATGLSFTNLRLGSPLPVQWVGLQQYGRVLADAAFQRALLNNAVFAGVVVPLQTGLALLLALVLNREIRGRAIFRTLFFMPVVFPMALVAVIWELIYAPGPNGLANGFLGFVTMGAWEPQNILGDAYLALPAIIVLSIWQGVGFQMIILLAGLQSIPEMLYDAARVDGANRWGRFAHVTLPQLRNPLIFTALVTSILALRVFDQVQIMTQGGPNDATTTVMFQTVRTVFERQQVGQASAMTVIFFVIVLVITWVQRTLVKEEREIE
jgi:multiple sugar transport system permease protein